MVTVDSGGSGDYVDLSDALAYVAAQTPAAGSRWVVYVYPGATDASGYAYSETSITIPNFTLVQGATSPSELNLLNASQPMVRITGTSGIGVTLGTGSNFADVGWNFTGALEAGYKALSCTTGCVATAARSMVFVIGTAPDVAFDLLSVTGGSFTGESLSFQRGGSGKVNARLVHVSSGSAVLYTPYLLSSSTQAVGAETTGTGVLRVLGGRSGGSPVLDFKNTAGTITLDSHAYNTESGTITRAGVLTPRHTHGTALPATCAVPETFTDSTAGAVRQCFCSASNTWTCNAGAVTSATAPYTCDAGHAGAVYVDTTTPSLCFCTGSAWTTTVALGNCS